MRANARHGPTEAAPPVYITANALVTTGVTLDDAVQTALAASLDGFELRRELLPPSWSAIQADGLREALARFRLPPAYSTPQPLFAAGRLERNGVQRALSDAVALRCPIVKFPLGSGEIRREGVAAFAGLFAAWRHRLPALVATVENDQQPESADVYRWVRLFHMATELAFPLRMTFDLGNWRCVGVDPLEAAELLGPHVAYVHVKATGRRDGWWESQPIQPADAVHPALAVLPPAVPRAIEFPVAGGADGDRVHAIQRYVAMVRSGRFVA